MKLEPRGRWDTMNLLTVLAIILIAAWMFFYAMDAGNRLNESLKLEPEPEPKPVAEKIEPSGSQFIK